MLSLFGVTVVLYLTRSELGKVALIATIYHHGNLSCMQSSNRTKIINLQFVIIMLSSYSDIVRGHFLPPLPTLENSEKVQSE